MGNKIEPPPQKKNNKDFIRDNHRNIHARGEKNDSEIVLILDKDKWNCVLEN